MSGRPAASARVFGLAPPKVLDNRRAVNAQHPVLVAIAPRIFADIPTDWHQIALRNRESANLGRSEKQLGKHHASEYSILERPVITHDLPSHL